MKIGKEYVLVIIGGLVLLAHVLQAGVKPLNLNLASPYQFLNPGYFQAYPFTSVIIFLRTLALFLFPLWLFSFFEGAWYAKGGILLAASGLMQLYSLQQVAGRDAPLVSLEWSLALTAAGLILLLPTLVFFLRGMGSGVSQTVKQKITAAPDPFSDEDDD